jgi:hypothetical protein
MRSDLGLRRNIQLQLLAMLVGVLVGGYTLVVWLGSPGDLLISAQTSKPRSLAA